MVKKVMASVYADGFENFDGILYFKTIYLHFTLDFGLLEDDTFIIIV